MSDNSTIRDRISRRLENHEPPTREQFRWLFEQLTPEEQQKAKALIWDAVVQAAFERGGAAEVTRVASELREGRNHG